MQIPEHFDTQPSYLILEKVTEWRWKRPFNPTIAELDLYFRELDNILDKVGDRDVETT